MHGEGQVLVHAAVAPPDAAGVGVGARERARAPSTWRSSRPALGASRRDARRRPAAALALVQAPAAQVVRAGDDAGRDRLRHPGAVHEVADLGRHAHQVAGREAQPLARRAVWIQSGLRCEISFRYFALPLRVWMSVGRRNVGSSTISPRRRVQVVAVDVAADVAGQRLLGPAPVHAASASRSRACATASGSRPPPRRRPRRPTGLPPDAHDAASSGSVRRPSGTATGLLAAARGRRAR